MSTGPLDGPHPAFRSVVVVGGHLVDLPDRPESRFPASAEREVTATTAGALASWEVGAGSLVISGGARGGDIIAAEQAIERGAEVWLLVALADDDFVDASVRIDGTDWAARYRTLRATCPTWFQAESIGPASTPEDAFLRNNRWMLEVGAALAAPGALKVLVVWDGRQGDGPGGTADLAAAAEAYDAEVVVIDPRTS